MRRASFWALLLALAWRAAPARSQSISPTLDGIEGTAQDGQPQSLNAQAQALLQSASGAGGGGEVSNVGLTVQAQDGNLLRLRLVDAQTQQAEAARAQARAAQDAAHQRKLWLALGVMALAGLWLAGEWVKRALRDKKPAAGGEASWADQFHIVRAIGEGGMGIVYEAVDRTLGRRVAVKKMRDELKAGPALEQFLSEARTVAALHHPCIVDIHSIVSQGGEVYLVFEYVEGRTLESLLRERGRFALPEVKAGLRGICEALEFAHQNKVIHRDLKPANVMVTAQGYVKVMDFGIARKTGEKVSAEPSSSGLDVHKTDTVRGTLLYMAPEAYYGAVCAQTDIYALGVMTYQMLLGKPPFEASMDPTPKLERNYVRLSQAAPGFSSALDAVLDAALEPDPAKRTASALGFWQALNAC